jgi:hypothetical protein
MSGGSNATRRSSLLAEVLNFGLILRIRIFTIPLINIDLDRRARARFSPFPRSVIVAVVNFIGTKLCMTSSDA